MSKLTSRPTNRRRVLTTLGGGGILALAGCLGGEEEEEEPEEDDDGIEEEDDDEVEEEDDDEEEVEEDDDEEDDDEELSSMEPGPEGEPISEEEIAALVEIFDDQPMNDDQLEVEGENRAYTPRHVWKWVSDETLIGLHFDEPNPEEATALDYITIGQKGLFTEESQPDVEFTHFHQHTADGWEAGHGGETGDEGYWLTHIAAGDIEYPFHDEPIGPQVDFGFMPTPPEEGSEGHETDFETPDGGEGSLSDEDRDALIEVFDDEWTNEAQMEADGRTPAHVWKHLSEDVVLFLHWDNPNPEEAEDLIYFGLGVRGQFTADDIPADQTDEFTHFHKWDADSWEAGHGGQDPEQHGYWLVHHSVTDHEMPWGDVEVGIDREFMPTPPE